MHSVGIHSALAIKRQRKRRDEQRRAKERRYSIQSSESGDTLHSPHGSTRRKFHHKHYASKSNTAMLESQVVTSIGMLHIGVVFIVFGVFLLGAGIIPDDTPSWNMFGSSSSWWNEVTCTGLFSTGLGIFLLVLNCLISKKEEEDLEDYVQRQLTRSRSGHRLERDAETGVLTTRHTRKALALKHDSFDNLSHSNVTPETSEMVTPTTPVGIGNSGDMLLEKIMEEDSSYTDERNCGEIQSPVGNDKRYLLGNGHTIGGNIPITRI
ncbi:unnamed protein product [Hermetia illucens]|uniref:Uncharacterized protein n=1 Tax=Hermetia illucens TaxID=343691 RepID=A0A7R8YW78_HERIL|nr:uncharacterized protein LOC119651066 isoform X2 [Hermetia illucens]CAD7086536.1 unnamed protein product [Hermetia illucens]